MICRAGGFGRVTVSLLSCALLLAPPTARADDIDSLQNLTQAQFRVLAEDLVMALSYKAVSPAEPLGVTGFDVGVGLSVTETSGGVWKLATGSGTDYLPMPRVMLQKGLPFGIDVGGFYAAAPGSNIKLWGGELKYAILEGGTVMPALAVRGAITGMSGVDDLDLETQSLELVVSKGLLNITPYGGIGQIWSSVTPSSTSSLGLPLRKESPSMTRVHAGLGFKVILVNFAVELDHTGDSFGASTRFGLRW
jgi:hypothetical protein